jgi:hypothetical protein
VLRDRPKNAHEHMGYQLEKIYCDLDPEKNEAYVKMGLWAVKAFSKEFAKKYVKINADEMSFDEIKLLVAAACFLEAQNQKTTMNKP